MPPVCSCPSTPASNRTTIVYSTPPFKLAWHAHKAPSVIDVVTKQALACDQRHPQAPPPAPSSYHFHSSFLLRGALRQSPIPSGPPSRPPPISSPLRPALISFRPKPRDRSANTAAHPRSTNHSPTRTRREPPSAQARIQHRLQSILHGWIDEHQI